MHTLLDFDFDLDVILYGIASHDKDFKLAAELNRLCKLDFAKTKDIVLVRNTEHIVFSNYLFEDEENRLTFRLISNRSYGGNLIPEQKSAQYFFMVEGVIGVFNNQVFEQQLSKCKSVLTYFQIDANSLKSKENLIFE